MMPVNVRRGRHGLHWRGLLYVVALLGEALRPGVAQAKTDLPVVRLQLQWFHQAQFVGYYVAHALGFYDHEGVAVEFIQGGPPVPGAPATDSLQMLSYGAADVAVAWLSSALEFRSGGGDVVNIAQIFKRPATLLVCRRAAGIHRPDDLRGRTIGVWNVGDQHDVRYWLRLRGLGSEAAALVIQRPDGRDLIEGRVDCATAMSYNEYWTLLRDGFSLGDLFIIRFANESSGFLEDGLYATGAAVGDPLQRDRLTRFLRASAAGWRYANDNPEVALAITLTWAPLGDRDHQRRMLESVLSLADPSKGFGLLELAAFERSVRIIGLGVANAPMVAAAARSSWTHRIWIDAGLDDKGGRILTPAVRHYLLQVVNSYWFYAFGLVGTVGYALSGFMQAVQRRYDLWGAFMLALLVAAGGGMLRDLLVGRVPPFIFTDPNYLVIVFAVVLFGVGTTQLLSDRAPQSRAFDRTMILADTIGFATFTVVGAQVALMADLGWYWIPLCAGLSCAGGGMLLDIVTGREPRTFQGELYEEIAAAGGLLMFAALLVVNRYESTDWLVATVVVTTMLLVFMARLAVVRYGVSSYRLGVPPSR